MNWRALYIYIYIYTSVFHLNKSNFPNKTCNSWPVVTKCNELLIWRDQLKIVTIHLPLAHSGILFLSIFHGHVSTAAIFLVWYCYHLFHILLTIISWGGVFYNVCFLHFSEHFTKPVIITGDYVVCLAGVGRDISQSI